MTTLFETRPRPRPSLADAIAAGGGIALSIGTSIIAGDVYSPDGDNELAALVMFGLLAFSMFALFLLPKLTHAAWIVATVYAVPYFWGFLLEPDEDIPRLLIILTIVSYLGLWVAPKTRGRPVYIALVLLIVWGWAMLEVGDADYNSAPIPPQAPTAENAALSTRPAQTDITLEDLDPADPLYPLAEDCANGDDAACDELWISSSVGSDFEDYAETCGGRGERGFGTCVEPVEDDFTDDEFEDDFTDDEFEDNFEDDFSDEFDDDFSDDDFEPQPFVDTSPGDSDKELEFGLISLVFAVVYLGALRIGDSRGYEYLGTATVIPGLVTLTAAVFFLGNATGELFAGTAMGIAAGLAVAVIGYLGRRRFTTWIGSAAILASVAIMTLDIVNFGDTFLYGGGEEPPEAIDTGLIAIAFGFALVIVAFLAAHIVGEGNAPPPPPADEADPGSPPPPDESPAPQWVPAATVPVATTEQWAPPPAPAPPSSGWAPAPVPEPTPAPAPEPPAPAPEPPAPAPEAPAPWTAAPPPPPPVEP